MLSLTPRYVSWHGIRLCALLVNFGFSENVSQWLCALRISQHTVRLYRCFSQWTVRLRTVFVSKQSDSTDVLVSANSDSALFLLAHSPTLLCFSQHAVQLHNVLVNVQSDFALFLLTRSPSPCCLCQCAVGLCSILFLIFYESENENGSMWKPHNKGSWLVWFMKEEIPKYLVRQSL